MADADEFDSWLTGRLQADGAPAAADDASTSIGGLASWLTPSVPPIPTDPSELTSMLWGAALRVKETVAEKIDGNIADFQTERARALAEAQRATAATPADAAGASPPWVVLAERFQILEADLKAQILELSRSESTFLEGPARAADGALYLSDGRAFDLHAALPTCLAALAEDEALRVRRFELVPARIDEATFWRNYFEAVQALKDAILASSVHLNAISEIAISEPRGGAAGSAAGARGAVGGGAAASGAGARAHAADDVADRIARELAFDDADLEVVGGAVAQPAGGGAGGAAAAPSGPVPTAQPPPPTPAAASAAAPVAAPPAGPTAPERPAEPEPQPEGGALDSDDDLDKLLDLGDDELGEDEDGEDVEI